MTVFWETKELGEVAYLAGRIGWKGLTAKEYTTSGPLFTSVHSLNHGDYVDFGEAFHISQERYDESPEIMLEPNDILICKDGAGIGKVGIVGRLPGPATINSSLLLIRAAEGVYPKFLYFGLCSPSFQKIVQERIDGATTPHLYQREIRQFPIPVPPLPEQKRIVAILDEAFVGIAAATANVEKNLANARELFEATLSNILTGNSEDWPRYKLEEMVEANCTLSYGIVQPGEEVADGLPIVRPTDLSRHVIDLDGLKRIDPALAHGYSRTKLLGGELLLCVRGSTGGISIASSELAGGNVTRGIVPIRFSPSAVSQKLGYYLFLSKHVQDQIRAATYGTALMQINIRDLRQLAFIVPPSEDQPALLRELESIAMNTERLKEIYEQKLTELADLKQAILQKAFSGELSGIKTRHCEAA